MKKLADYIRTGQGYIFLYIGLIVALLNACAAHAKR